MRRRLLNSNKSISLPTYKVGDIVVYDLVKNRFVLFDQNDVITDDAYKDRNIPVAVVYGVGSGYIKCMSLNVMSVSSPTQGTSNYSTAKMIWKATSLSSDFPNIKGKRNVIISCGYVNNIWPVYPNFHGSTWSDSGSTFAAAYTPINASINPEESEYKFPSDRDQCGYYSNKWSEEDAKTVKATYTFADTKFSNQNNIEAYYSPMFYEGGFPYIPAHPVGAVTYIGGAHVDTQTIAEYADAKSTSWRTASSVSNTFCAPLSCYRFCPTYNGQSLGFSVGDWYLPSCGELCLAAARSELINKVISNTEIPIKKRFNLTKDISVVNFKNTPQLTSLTWQSTGGYEPYYVDFSDGLVTRASYSYKTHVRAVTEFIKYPSYSTNEHIIYPPNWLNG